MDSYPRNSVIVFETFKNEQMTNMALKRCISINIVHVVCNPSNRVFVVYTGVGRMTTVALGVSTAADSSPGAADSRGTRTSAQSAA